MKYCNRYNFSQTWKKSEQIFINFKGKWVLLKPAKNYFIGQNTIFWVTTLCSSEISPRFAETHRLQFRGRRISEAWNQQFLGYSLTPSLYAIRSLELLGFLRTAWNHISEEHYSHCHENLTPTCFTALHVKSQQLNSTDTQKPESYHSHDATLTCHDLSNPPGPIPRRLYIRVNVPVTVGILSL
jgi:hypothetical protein